MSRTAAGFTQADIARAIRAAQQTGVTGGVELRPDGTIFIRLSPNAQASGHRADDQVVKVRL